MTITQEQRTELHQAVRGLIGVGPAETLMDYMAHDGWDSVARVEHVELAATRMEARLTESRQDFEQRINQVQAELSDRINRVQSELNDRIDRVQIELIDRINQVQAELSDRINTLEVSMHRAFANQTRWLAGLMGSLVVAMIVSLLR